MVPLSMTLSHLWPGFQSNVIFWSQISEKTARLKDKVTIAQEEKCVTYGTILCLLTFTDLRMRRAGLSASTELHVCYMLTVGGQKILCCVCVKECVGFIVPFTPPCLRSLSEKNKGE